LFIFAISAAGKEENSATHKLTNTRKTAQQRAADFPSLLDISFFLMRQAIFTSFHLERDQATTKNFCFFSNKEILHELFSLFWIERERESENLTKENLRENYERKRSF
jgi:hypothetical protein